MTGHRRRSTIRKKPKPYISASYRSAEHALLMKEAEIEFKRAIQPPPAGRPRKGILVGSKSDTIEED